MLLERDGLLDDLLGLRHSAAEGSGSLALIAGEAGAGKSTVVRAFLDRLGQSTVTAIGACDPLDTPRPLGPLLDVSDDLRIASADIATDAADRFEVFESALDRMRSSIRPVVLVIEDIHWADEGTLDFLRFVGRRVGNTNGIIVCTYRDDEVAGDHALRRVLGQITPLPTTHRFDVPSLTPSAVAALARGTGVDADELYARTGGNAFFVTEVLASDAPVPSTVTDAVLARIARLDDDARALVEAVAISPRDLDVDRAADLAGTDSGVVDAAVGSGVLVMARTHVHFRHDIARAAVEDGLPPVRRLGLHRRMIELLEGDDPRDVIRLAHHAGRAGDADRIVRYAPDAAEEAVIRGSRREAIAFYRTALQHSDRLAREREAELLVGLGQQLLAVEAYAESAAALGRATAIYRSSGDARALARALVSQQSAVWMTEGKEAGWALTAEARRLLEADGPSEELALVHYRTAHNHMVDRRHRPAREAAMEARRIAEIAGSSKELWRADMMLGCIEIVMGDAALGEAMLQRSYRDAETMGDIGAMTVAIGMLGSGGGESRRYDVAIAALERGVEHAVATDSDDSAAYNRAWLGRVAFEQGRYDEASRYAEASLSTTSHSNGISGVTARCALGRVRVRRGDPGGSAVLDDVIAIGDDHLFQYVWNAYCGRAEHAWLTGRLRTEGSAILRHAHDRAMTSDSPWARGEVGFWMWRAGLIDAPPDGAAEPFALQIAGDWEAAADQWNAIGCPFEQAIALADGDEDAMRSAIEILDQLGATPASRRVRVALRDRGVRGVPRGPTRATRTNPAGLTNRQLEVLGLMAGGLSNAEIADRLFVSKKTVEHHVSAVLTKLEADSRTRAVAIAHDRGFLEKSG